MNTSTEPRFGFGRNWQNYAKTLSEEQILAAMESLRTMLGVHDLSHLRVLDAGCGSGLFSLAACRLGAREVIGFDNDANCVSCAQDLNQQFGPYTNWTVMQGDILDKKLPLRLGEFDIVYSWGVLHHTGNMWQALDNVCTLVRQCGTLFISIYNDQGRISRIWRIVKKIYVHSPITIKRIMAIIWYGVVVSVRICSGLRYRKPIRVWFKGSERGMNLWYDVVDWIGGYPFETASAESLQRFFENRNFTLTNVRLKSGSGCNELILKRTGEIP